MNISELCIRRPVMTTLLTAAMVIFGLFAYRLLPVAALPRIEFPTLVVSANLAGASPETMASAVATPLEKQFATIAGIESITSSNGLGSTRITLQFALDRSLDAAALDVQSAIGVAQRRLPSEMTSPPYFRKVNPADHPILLLALRSPTLPLATINDYAENVVGRRLSTLSGVAQVLVYGQQRYAVRLRVDLARLHAMDLTLNELEQAVAAANSNTPTGVLAGNARQVTIQATGQLPDAAAFRPLIVAWKNGAPVRLEDVAEVIDSVESDKLASWFNGERAIILAVQRQPDANTVAVNAAIHELLPKFREQLPPAVELQVLVDRSISVRDSLRDIQYTLGLTIILVLLVIFFFLRSAVATLAPAVVLPVSLLAACGVMYLLEFSLNTMSLMAMTLSVGFVVDDVIVMMENIVRHIEAGEERLAAAFRGSREIGFTIISITLSLVAAFIPVLFMSGVVGRLFNEFAVTIAVTILVSGLVSLTLTPLMCSRLLPHPGQQIRHGALYRWAGRVFDAMLNSYRRALDLALRHTLFMLLLTLSTLAMTVWLFSVTPKGFFPSEDNGLIMGTTVAAEDISFTEMVTLQQTLVEQLRTDPDVESLNSTVGAGGPNSAMNNGRLFIVLKPRNQRASSAIQIIQRLREMAVKLPGMSLYMQPVQNISIGARSSKSEFQYTVQATDMGDLIEWGPIIEEQMKQLKVLKDVTSDLQLNNPLVSVELDREKAAQLGVSSESLRTALFNAYGTHSIATLYTASDAYSVILEVKQEYQNDEGDLAQLKVRSTSGALIPLESFARVVRTAGPSQVNHQDQLPSATISFNLTPGVALGEAVAQIRAMEAQLGLPSSMMAGFKGTAQVFQQSTENQALLILAALVVVYIVLGVLYESYIHPLTILSGLPTAAIGALLFLLLFKQDLNVMAIIGLVMLIGIVKKNAIMMIDFALARQHEGVAPFDAIREACLLRFRPIMMTTMAALMGALPIALGLGAGGELRQPLGLTVVGGLLLSQFLTLFITPVIYIYMEKARALVIKSPPTGPPRTST